MRIRTHAAGADGREFGEFRPERAAFVEEFFGPITLHPFFEDFDVCGILMHFAHRHLMRSPVVFSLSSVDLFRAGPALWCAKHDHRPAGAFGEPILARIGLDATDLADDGVEGGGHQLVHRLRLITLDEIRRIPVAAEEVI